MKFMVLNDLLDKMWYLQDIAIIERKKYNVLRESMDLSKFKDQALFSGPSYKANSHLLNRLVESYGVVDNVFIITIYD